MMGTPLYRAATPRKRVFVTIERRNSDGSYTYVGLKLWTGRTIAGIKRAAKRAYPDCYLQFGRWF